MINKIDEKMIDILKDYWMQAGIEEKTFSDAVKEYEIRRSNKGIIINSILILPKCVHTSKIDITFDYKNKDKLK